MVKKKKSTGRVPRWKGKVTQEEIENNEGFVYIIKNELTGMFYIGKKSFWSNRTLPPLKGKNQKRHVRKESDWRAYWGSSNWLKEDIEKYGLENFSKQILHVCKSKFQTSYEELMWQLKLNVLNDPKSYNCIINVRLRVWKDKGEIKGEVEDDKA